MRSVRRCPAADDGKQSNARGAALWGGVGK
jgi:hypothetical protein